MPTVTNGNTNSPTLMIAEKLSDGILGIPALPRIEAEVWHCHCSQCRRAHGAAFGSYAGVEPENFKWTSGEELVRTYAPGDGGFLFCSQCGSNVAGSWKGEICQVTFGTMEGDPEVHPNQHIFVGSRALQIR